MATIRDALEVYYPIYWVLTLFLNLFLIYLVVFKSPKSFKFLKVVLTQTSILQIFLSTAITFLQNRLIGTSIPMEIRSYGLCRCFNAKLCFLFYLLHQTIMGASAVSLCFTFYYKHYSIKPLTSLDNRGYLRAYFVFFIPTFISIICAFIIITRDSDMLHNLDLTNVETTNKIIGYSKLTTLPNFVNQVYMAATTLATPIFCLIYRIKIKSTISAAVSARTFEQTRSFVKGLTIQASLPIIFYVPTRIFHHYCLFTGYESMFQQYLLNPMTCLPTLIDPVISLYFIKPYRRYILDLMRNPFGSRVTIMHSVQSSNQGKSVVTKI